jgi:hypothetical protein
MVLVGCNNRYDCFYGTNKVKPSKAFGHVLRGQMQFCWIVLLLVGVTKDTNVVVPL